MTPADEIRAAAEKLRKHAAAATPGAWTVDSSIPYGHRVGSRDEADWVAWTGEHGETGSENDAAYIAAMHPGVGTALADWLMTEANTWAGDEVHYRCSPQSCTLDAVLAVARAINGPA